MEYFNIVHRLVIQDMLGREWRITSPDKINSNKNPNKTTFWDAELLMPEAGYYLSHFWGTKPRLELNWASVLPVFRVDLGFSKSASIHFFWEYDVMLLPSHHRLSEPSRSEFLLFVVVIVVENFPFSRHNLTAQAVLRSCMQTSCTQSKHSTSQQVDFQPGSKGS